MSYVRMQRWFENGPQRVAGVAASSARLPVVLPLPRPRIPAASVYRMRELARRGMGATEYHTAGPLSLSQEYCDSGWSLLNPVAWFGGCLEADVNNVKQATAEKYEEIQYGHIPRPSELPTPPAPPPANPVTGIPEQTGAQQMEQWGKDVNAALDQARQSGSWNPSGNLPFNAIELTNFWDRYGTAFTIAGVGVLGYVAFKVATR